MFLVRIFLRFAQQLVADYTVSIFFRVIRDKFFYERVKEYCIKGL